MITLMYHLKSFRLLGADLAYDGVPLEEELDPIVHDFGLILALMCLAVLVKKFAS
jgi:hypothetical protein